MEEPSSPLSPHLLNHLGPTTAASASSPLPSPGVPAYPDVCLLPNAHAPPHAPPCLVGSASYGLPRPRNGGRSFIPSSSLQPHYQQGIEAILNEDELYQNSVQADNASLQVNCQLYSTDSNSITSQPITPSPRALHDNTSAGGWKVLSGGSSNLGAEGRRIGYDGTTQTPSVQLLKPTASSLGHRVSKPPNRPQPTLSPPKSFSSNAYSPDVPNNQSNDSSGFNQVRKATQMSNMMFETPTMDPFGKLNQSTQSNSNATSDDDTEMEEKTQNSSSLLEEFDAFDMVTAEDRNYHQPSRFDNDMSKMLPGGLFPPQPLTSLQRCSSWSPGGGYIGFNTSGKSNPERLRSYNNFDPVASQLLKACAFQEEEEEEDEGDDEVDQLSKSESHVKTFHRSKSDSGGPGGWNMSCHSPTTSSNDNNHTNNGYPDFSSSSLPDRVNPTTTRRSCVGKGRKVAPMISEGAPLNYPLSPRVPQFGDSISSLGGVAEEEAKSLARPVPRKIGSAPTLFLGSSRRSSLPRHM